MEECELSLKSQHGNNSYSAQADLLTADRASSTSLLLHLLLQPPSPLPCVSVLARFSLIFHLQLRIIDASGGNASGVTFKDTQTNN